MDWSICQGEGVGVDVSVGSGGGLDSAEFVGCGVVVGLSKAGFGVRVDVAVEIAVIRVVEIVDNSGFEISGVVG